MFVVPTGVSTATVQGTFTVSNGRDIKAYITNGTNLSDWQNGLNSNMYFSGNGSAGNVTTSVPPNWTYYLVYDNTYSTISKNITTNVDYFYVPID